MNNYWEERMLKTLTDAEDLELEFEKTLGALYRDAIKKIQSDIDVFYSKYAEKNQISLTDAKKLLTSTELKDLKQNIQDYIALLEEYEFMPAPTEEFISKLDKMQNRARVSRLEALKLELEYALVDLLTSQENAQTKTYLNDFKNAFNDTLYALQTQLEVGVSFTKPTKDTVLAILKEKYLEENFSSRVWKNKDYLIDVLQQELLRGFVQGKSNIQIGDEIAKKLNAQKNAAQVLARTETNNICNQASLRAYDSQNIAKYQILATLDYKTSDICRMMDSKIFKTSEATRGINYPPFHPNCRTTTIPYIEGNENALRLAKGEDGYYAVQNISYKEWDKKYKNSIDF